MKIRTNLVKRLTVLHSYFKYSSAGEGYSFGAPSTQPPPQTAIGATSSPPSPGYIFGPGFNITSSPSSQVFFGGGGTGAANGGTALSAPTAQYYGTAMGPSAAPAQLPPAPLANLNAVPPGAAYPYSTSAPNYGVGTTPSVSVTSPAGTVFTSPGVSIGGAASASGVKVGVGNGTLPSAIADVGASVGSVGVSRSNPNSSNRGVVATATGSAHGVQLPASSVGLSAGPPFLSTSSSSSAAVSSGAAKFVDPFPRPATASVPTVLKTPGTVSITVRGPDRVGLGDPFPTPRGGGGTNPGTALGSSYSAAAGSTGVSISNGASAGIRPGAASSYGPSYSSSASAGLIGYKSTASYGVGTNSTSGTSVAFMTGQTLGSYGSLGSNANGTGSISGTSNSSAYGSSASVYSMQPNQSSSITPASNKGISDVLRTVTGSKASPTAAAGVDLGALPSPVPTPKPSISEDTTSYSRSSTLTLTADDEQQQQRSRTRHFEEIKLSKRFVVPPQNFPERGPKTPTTPTMTTQAPMPGGQYAPLNATLTSVAETRQYAPIRADGGLSSPRPTSAPSDGRRRTDAYGQPLPQAQVPPQPQQLLIQPQLTLKSTQEPPTPVRTGELYYSSEAPQVQSVLSTKSVPVSAPSMEHVSTKNRVANWFGTLTKRGGRKAGHAHVPIPVESPPQTQAPLRLGPQHGENFTLGHPVPNYLKSSPTNPVAADFTTDLTQNQVIRASTPPASSSPVELPSIDTLMPVDYSDPTLQQPGQGGSGTGGGLQRASKPGMGNSASTRVRPSAGFSIGAETEAGADGRRDQGSDIGAMEQLEPGSGYYTGDPVDFTRPPPSEFVKMPAYEYKKNQHAQGSIKMIRRRFNNEAITVRELGSMGMMPAGVAGAEALRQTTLLGGVQGGYFPSYAGQGGYGNGNNRMPMGPMAVAGRPQYSPAVSVPGFQGASRSAFANAPPPTPRYGGMYVEGSSGQYSVGAGGPASSGGVPPMAYSDENPLFSRYKAGGGAYSPFHRSTTGADYSYQHSASDTAFWQRSGGPSFQQAGLSLANDGGGGGNAVRNQSGPQYYSGGGTQSPTGTAQKTVYQVGAGHTPISTR